jgi:DNA-directed RNA polymerase specialized sigma24 family protein
MPSNPISLESSFLPEEPTYPQGEEFFAQVSGMLDGQPKEAATVETALSGWDALLEKMGSDTYRIGSMLIGEGEETIRLIEEVVTDVDIRACSSHQEARHRSRLILAAKAISVLAARDSASHPSSLAAPDKNSGDSGPVSCIEDDDLSSAGVTSAELEQMLTGPDSHHLRDWLEGLSVSLRVIFVLRAVAGLSSPEIAGLLAEHGGPAAQDWTPETVRSSFRQALCSLASQLLQASAAK